MTCMSDTFVLSLAHTHAQISKRQHFTICTFNSDYCKGEDVRGGAMDGAGRGASQFRKRCVGRENEIERRERKSDGERRCEQHYG